MLQDEEHNRISIEELQDHAYIKAFAQGSLFTKKIALSHQTILQQNNPYNYLKVPQREDYRIKLKTDGLEAFHKYKAQLLL